MELFSSFNFRHPGLLRHCPVTIYLLFLFRGDLQCSGFDEECSCHLQDKAGGPRGNLELELCHPCWFRLSDIYLDSSLQSHWPRREVSPVVRSLRWCPALRFPWRWRNLGYHLESASLHRIPLFRTGLYQWGLFTQLARNRDHGPGSSPRDGSPCRVGHQFHRTACSVGSTTGTEW